MPRANRSRQHPLWVAQQAIHLVEVVHKEIHGDST